MNEPEENSAATPLAEMASRAASEAAARATEASAGAGSPLDSAPGLVPPSAANGQVWIADSVKAIVRAIDGAMGRRIYSAAHQVTGCTEVAESLRAEAAITDSELEIIGNLSAVVAAKYQLASEYAAEIGLVCVAGGYYLRVTSSLKRLEQLKTPDQGKEDERQNEGMGA